MQIADVGAQFAGDREAEFVADAHSTSRVDLVGQNIFLIFQLDRDLGTG